ncbi:MAG: hypothetical protein WC314_17730 [Vulcanimicrobiota bacterium]
MSSIYLSKDLKARFLSAARRRGFKVGRGPTSELNEYIAYLLDLDEAQQVSGTSSTLDRARGLLSKQDPPDDEAVRNLLDERFL